ncbi:MAG: hypothetical protein QXS06_02910 [Desulfurococcaceae archaeon]
MNEAVEEGLLEVRDIVLAGMNAALYALVGYLTHLGVFAIGVGVVRFWPAVFIPAVFSVVFSPVVGGIGAAVGIFISDMLVHGNALLSLTVGVPANYVCFHLIGYIARRMAGFKPRLTYVSSIILQALPPLVIVLLYYINLIDLSIALTYLVISIVSLAPTVVSMTLYKEYIPPSQAVAYTIGLMSGSAIIGVGLWFYSQFLPLPGGVVNAPLAMALIWFMWTYYTEIPFLMILAPPIVKSLETRLKK